MSTVQACFSEPLGPTSEQFFDSSLGFLSGGGEMGALMRARDWKHTSLGSPQDWPHSLKTAVGLLLNSKYPMFMGWGADLTMFYNDAYRPILGALKHPHALGDSARHVWAEIW